MDFKGFRCCHCGSVLPAELREDNRKMLRVWCIRCGRWTYINSLKVVKDIRDLKKPKA